MIDFEIRDPVFDTYFLFVQTSEAVSRHVQARLRNAGITPVEFEVLLALLKNKETMNPTEISRRIHRNKNTLTGVIDNMERDGLVERKRSRKDRRVINIRATGRGRELYGRLAEPIGKIVFDAMSCFRKEELAEFSRLLQLLRRQALESSFWQSQEDKGYYSSNRNQIKSPVDGNHWGEDTEVATRLHSTAPSNEVNTI